MVPKPSENVTKVLEIDHKTTRIRSEYDPYVAKGDLWSAPACGFEIVAVWSMPKPAILCLRAKGTMRNFTVKLQIDISWSLTGERFVFKWMKCHAQQNLGTVCHNVEGPRMGCRLHSNVCFMCGAFLLFSRFSKQFSGIARPWNSFFSWHNIYNSLSAQHEHSVVAPDRTAL